MPCQAPSHEEHVWPLVPNTNGCTITFTIQPCERLCFFCYCRGTSRKEYASVDSLREHVKRAHISQKHYPGVILDTSRNSRGRSKPSTGKLSVKRRAMSGKITVPINTNCPPSERLNALCKLLQILSRSEDTFRALLSKHITSHHDVTQPSTSPQIIASLACSFLKLYGPSLWPSSSARRKHLATIELSTQPGNFWTFRRGLLGPEFDIDGTLNANELMHWRRNNDGREPTSDQQLASSKLGVVLKEYLSALMEVSTPNTSHSAESSWSEEELVGKIVGHVDLDGVSPRGEVNMLGMDRTAGSDLDRDSSPDIPLRTAVQLRNREPEASLDEHLDQITITTELPDDDEKQYCVLDECRHRRKTLGKEMVGCDNQKCPIEWFYPEYVELEGRDLGVIEWQCRYCSGTPQLPAPGVVPAQTEDREKPDNADQLVQSIQTFLDTVENHNEEMQSEGDVKSGEGEAPARREDLLRAHATTTLTDHQSNSSTQADQVGRIDPGPFAASVARINFKIPSTRRGHATAETMRLPVGSQSTSTTLQTHTPAGMTRLPTGSQSATAIPRSHGLPSPSARSRQQSLNMPPPSRPNTNSRGSGMVSQSGPSSSSAMQRPAQNLENTRRPSSHTPAMPPVTPLQPHQWILPTPTSTLRIGTSVEGETSEEVRRRVEQYLEMTGGLGGLPTD